MNRKVFFLLTSMLAWHGAMQAQILVQVVTKTIEKTFPFRPGYEVNVEGEKAEVFFETWNRQEIAVRIELTARHPEKSVAERDLAAMQYLTQRVKNKIYLRNYLSADPDAPKPESSFSAVYYVQLPEDCPVYIKNYFGQATVKNLTNNLRVRGEFSRINLANLKGTVDISSRFGDISGLDIDGNVSINARRSDITLREIKGSYDINAQYGVIRIFAGMDLFNLNIDADKSEVFFFTPNPQWYAYTLSVVNGNISTTEPFPFKTLEQNTSMKKVQFKPNREYYANISISISFGDINVERVR